MKYLIFSLLFVGLLMPLGAAEYFSGQSVVISEEDTLYTDVFAGCRNMDVVGVVQGDVVVGCERLSIDGYVRDDVLSGCRIIEIKGAVGDGVTAFGETIIIDGEVHGDVRAFGGVVRITERALIKGNLIIGSGELIFDGHVGGYIKGGSAEMDLNGTVGDYVEVGAEDIAFGPDYRAENGTKLTLPKPVEYYELTNAPDNLEVTVMKEPIFLQTGFFYWSLLALLIVGIVIVGLSKQFSRDYLDYTSKQFGKSLGYGLLLLILVPVAIVILAVLILTIPISLMLLAVYLVILYLSFAFAALFIGDYVLSLFRKEPTRNGLFLAVLIGVLLVSLLPHVPFVGGLFTLLIICLGMGSLVLYLWALRQPEEAKAAE